MALCLWICCRLRLEPAVHLLLSLPDVSRPSHGLLRLSHLLQEVLPLGTASAGRQVCRLSLPQEKGQGTLCSLRPALRPLPSAAPSGGRHRRCWGRRCRPPSHRRSLCPQMSVHHSAVRVRQDQCPRPVQVGLLRGAALAQPQAGLAPELLPSAADRITNTEETNCRDVLEGYKIRSEAGRMGEG